jgi:hypothetical protein
MEIEQARKLCTSSGKAGWELVDYAADVVQHAMRYSTDIPLKTPAQAFRAERGYCVQQAMCLKKILRGLGIPVVVVYAARVKITDAGHTFESGHTWCRVTLGGETRDVCTCHAGNRSGNPEKQRTHLFGRIRRRKSLQYQKQRKQNAWKMTAG